MLHIGIDPGKTGGIAAVADDGRLVGAWKMPNTRVGVYQRLREFQGATVLIEHVHARPGQSAVAGWTFAEHYGGLLMALDAVGFEWSKITPKKWQGLMRCLSEGDKRITKLRAQRLYPHVKMTHVIADAVLLAECCRRLASLHPEKVHPRSGAGDRDGQEDRSQEARPQKGRRSARAA